MQTLIYLLIGLGLGVFTLPWKHRLDDKAGVPLYLLGWVCFWALFLPMALWYGLKAYRRAWYCYLVRREAAHYWGSRD